LHDHVPGKNPEHIIGQHAHEQKSAVYLELASGEDPSPSRS